MRRLLSRAALVVSLSLGWCISGVSGQYQPTRSTTPLAFSSQRPNDQSLESRITAAWMANPMTAVPTLRIVLNRGILEVHGEVVNEQSRQMALAVARDNCHLPVTDHLRIRPFAVRGLSSANQTVAPASKVVPASASYPYPSSPNAGPTYITTQYHPAPVEPDATVVHPAPALPRQLGAAQRPVNATYPGYPTRVASSSDPQSFDLLKPPVPAERGVVQPDEMRLLQVPVIPGRTVAPSVPMSTVVGKPRTSSSGRPSQFAVASPHAQATTGAGVVVPSRPIVGLGLPALSQPTQQAVPLATLDATPRPAARPLPVATAATTPQVQFEVAEPALKPVATGSEEAQEIPEPMEYEAGVKTTINLEPDALRQRVLQICGNLARDVNVSMGPNQTYSVKILMVNDTAEEKITPKLLAMPELSSGQIRLEIHVPQ